MSMDEMNVKDGAERHDAALLLIGGADTWLKCARGRFGRIAHSRGRARRAEIGYAEAELRWAEEAIMAAMAAAMDSASRDADLARADGVRRSIERAAALLQSMGR